MMKQKFFCFFFLDEDIMKLPVDISGMLIPSECTALVLMHLLMLQISSTWQTD